MKTKQIINVFLILFILIGCMKVNAQDDGPDPNFNYSNSYKYKGDAKDIGKIFGKILETTKVDKWKGNQYCKPEELLKKIKIKDLGFNAKFYDYLNASSSLNRFYGNINPPHTEEKFDKGEFNTLKDKGLNAFSTTSGFLDFVTAFTGKNLGDIKGETETYDSDFFGSLKKVKDIDKLRSYYANIKYFLNTEGFLKHYRYKEGNCDVKVSYSIRVKKFDYPKVTWGFKIKVEIDCNCPIRDAPEEIKYGVVEYTAISEGILTSNTRKYGTPKNTKIKIIELVCCKGDIPEDEDASYIEPIEQPDQTIGYTAGLGFQNDFDEISYCVGVEYLKRISDKKSDTYLGGGVSYSGSSFNDFKTNTIMVGPKIQIHTPITPSGETQWVNGLKAYYSFGNQKNNGYTDKTTGIEASIYSGFNIQLNEKIAVGIEFPVITWDKITIKPENGSDYEFDNTSILLNKGNPIKLSLRYKF